MDSLYRPRSRLQQSHPYRRRPVRKRVVYAFWVAVILIFGVLFWKTGGLLSISPPQKPVNILLLGVGGGTHDGPDLTDTIIFMHIDPTDKKVSLVSLPRDLWVPDFHAKVNAAYTIASEKKPGSGLTYTKSIIGDILGQHIDYGVKLDFSGFIKAVDILGGLDITVDRTFDDYEYPISGKEDDTCGFSQDQVTSLSAATASGSSSETDAFPCRYKHIHFEKGKTHMDGETALEYVRSRHAIGPEGSDFARSKRQQKVISVFKAKLFSAGTLLNPVKMIGLIDTLQGSFETDIKQSKYGDFIRMAQSLKGANITSSVIDIGDSETGRYGLLIHPPVIDYGGAWVLAPRNGASDYSEIRQYVSCEINGGNCIVRQYGIVTPTPNPTETPSK